MQVQGHGHRQKLRSDLFMAALGLRCQVCFSLVAVIGGYSLVAVQRLLIVVTSLIEEHGL